MGEDTPDMRILAEAATWLERARHGDDADRRAFRDWLAERPEHVAAMDLVERAWRRAPAAARAAGVRVRRPARSRPALPGWGLPALGTALAAIAGVALWFGTVQDQRIQGAASGVRIATLADGSRVWLTPGSAVAFHTDLLGRSATLTGEASFDVHHERRPFRVEAGAIRVVDKGTLFAIARQGARTTVVLARGAIDVEDRQTGAAIASPMPGQQLVIEGDTATVSAVDAEEALAWRDGRVIARDVPLGTVAARFAELGGPRIRIADPSLARLRVYGSYRVDDVVPFLEATGALAPISWRRTEDGYEVRRR